MKRFYKFFLMLALFPAISFSQDLQSSIEELMQPLQKSKIVRVSYDPFKRSKEILQSVTEVEQVVQEPKILLSAIFNNKAYVNGAWRAKGDTVIGHEVVEIMPDMVLMKKSKKLMKFTLKKSKKLIEIRDGQ